MQERFCFFTFSLVEGGMSVTQNSSLGCLSFRKTEAEPGVFHRVLLTAFCLALLFACVLLFPANVRAEGSAGTVPNVIPPVGTHEGENVGQPIEFPHDTHASVNKINCMYCHTYARRSNVAGIPPTSKCMGCHNVIATDKPGVQKLTEYWEKREPPPWNKVHDVPDFVHFSHERHLKRFVFDNEELPVERVSEGCAFCHGEVKDMKVAHKVKPLNMGFCVRCHEANNGPSDCWQCHK